ncbi:hypothetical protein TEA_013729 [Camellia sinensis var. sinensis]|uniref:FAS1 domain-containing protein n=2 Tax=Camellia sinensis TaxID=4442 RepID=A0A4S4DKT6_CAMSN|nr:hypothetical protein TEA_013729 [Camellia sinensis var. sinensis]
MATPLQLSLLLLTSIFFSPTTIVTIDKSVELARDPWAIGSENITKNIYEGSPRHPPLSPPPPPPPFSHPPTLPSSSALPAPSLSSSKNTPSLPQGIRRRHGDHHARPLQRWICRRSRHPRLRRSPLSAFLQHRANEFSLFFPSPPPSTAVFSDMPQMLQDAMLRLRISGFSVLALSLRVKYSELSAFTAMTVFALDDSSIFAGGHSYVSDLRLHIVPDRRLMGADLESLAAATVLPTMEKGEKLVVTTASGGGPLAPMRINYAKITSFDLIYNLNIAVHRVSMPFTHVNQTDGVDSNRIRDCKQDDLGSKVAAKSGICQIDTPSMKIERTVENEDHRGL